MADTINKGDFVEIEYDGKLKEGDLLFDTTNEATAKKLGVFNPNVTYGKVVVCVGENQILVGIDKALEGKESEKEYDVEIIAEDGFGKKRSDLLKIVHTNVFKKENVQPMPGLQVNIDGMIGTIRTVTGGRTIVDFNHILAGKHLAYHLKVGKKITDKKEQVVSYLSLVLNLKKSAIEASVDGEKATVTLKMELPGEMKGQISDRVMKVTGLKSVDFKVKKEAKKEDEKPSEDKKE